MINYHNLSQLITSNAGIGSVCVLCGVACVCLGVCMCASGDVWDEMNISLCLCKQSGLLQDGALQIIYYYNGILLLLPYTALWLTGLKAPTN